MARHIGIQFFVKQFSSLRILARFLFIGTPGGRARRGTAWRALLLGLAVILSSGCDSTGPTTVPTENVPIAVTVSTTGANIDLDPDGYTLSVDGGSGQAVGVNATVTIADLPTGNHLVRLDGVASNCSVAGTNPRSLDVINGDKAASPVSVLFSVSCVAQPAEIIKISGDDQEGRPGDQLQPIIVAVRDPSGKPVPGVRVRFSVTAGDGWVGITPDANHWVIGYYFRPVQVTNGDGEAQVWWWVGRHGENTLLATVETEGKPLEVTFRATSVSSGYAGGSFALTSTGTSVKLYDFMAGGPYNCVVKSGSLVLSPDGSFVETGDFDCSDTSWGGSFSFNVIETGFYAVSDSTIKLHYLGSNDTAGFFDSHLFSDVHGVVSEDTIVFSSLGVEWRYTRLD